jgi:peptide subunit release factor 1 (eRF1)
MDIEFNFDEDEFRNAIADEVESMFIEYVETEVERGNIECDCGSWSFDVETWKNSNDEYEGAAICRDCNERIELEIDTSDIDALR